jgi:hypothetical protein
MSEVKKKRWGKSKEGGCSAGNCSAEKQTAGYSTRGHVVGPPPQSDNSCCLIVVTFHHLLNETKREDIPCWGQELALRGISKAGHPGVVIAEGERRNVHEFVKRLRQHRWQTMDIRLEESRPTGSKWRIPPSEGFFELCISNTTSEVVRWCNEPFFDSEMDELWKLSQEPDLSIDLSAVVIPGKPVDTWRGRMSTDLQRGKIYSEKRADDNNKVMTPAEALLRDCQR